MNEQLSQLFVKNRFYESRSCVVTDAAQQCPLRDHGGQPRHRVVLRSMAAVFLSFLMTFIF